MGFQQDISPPSFASSRGCFLLPLTRTSLPSFLSPRDGLWFITLSESQVFFFFLAALHLFTTRASLQRLAAQRVSAMSGTATAWPANRVRETFVNFFVEKAGHVNYKSSPVVPHDDPTLLFGAHIVASPPLPALCFHINPTPLPFAPCWHACFCVRSAPHTFFHHSLQPPCALQPMLA